MRPADGGACGRFQECVLSLVGAQELARRNIGNVANAGRGGNVAHHAVAGDVQLEAVGAFVGVHVGAEIVVAESTEAHDTSPLIWKAASANSTSAASP